MGGLGSARPAKPLFLAGTLPRSTLDKGYRLSGFPSSCFPSATATFNLHEPRQALLLIWVLSLGFLPPTLHHPSPDELQSLVWPFTISHEMSHHLPQLIALQRCVFHLSLQISTHANPDERYCSSGLFFLVSWASPKPRQATNACLAPLHL